MNYKPMLSKLTDFCINFAVASFAVSAFQEVWYGVIPGLTFLLVAIVLSTKLGGD